MFENYPHQKWVILSPLRWFRQQSSSLADIAEALQAVEGWGGEQGVDCLKTISILAYTATARSALNNAVNTPLCVAIQVCLEIINR